MTGSNRLRSDRQLLWFLLPGGLGLLVFYLLPYVMSFGYAMTDNTITRNFVGFENLIETLNNEIFIRALRNNILFIVLCVPLNMIISFLLAAGLRKLTRERSFFSLVFLFPLVIPSGSVIYLWDCLFRTEGVLNRLLMILGVYPVNWAESTFIMPIIIVLFIWKNAGYNMLLFWSGLNLVPEEYMDFAKLEGAGRWKIFRNITFVYLTPTTFLVLLMSIINSFKSFREIYLLFGQHPNNRIYMLQHYMNSQFHSLNLSRLTTASYILTFVITALIFVLFRAQKKLSENFS
jgi:multiple sugar transport system permease protein